MAHPPGSSRWCWHPGSLAPQHGNMAGGSQAPSSGQTCHTQLFKFRTSTLSLPEPGALKTPLSPMMAPGDSQCTALHTGEQGLGSERHQGLSLIVIKSDRFIYFFFQQNFGNYTAVTSMLRLLRGECHAFAKCQGRRCIRTTTNLSLHLTENKLTWIPFLKCYSVQFRLHPKGTNPCLLNW